MAPLSLSLDLGRHLPPFSPFSMHWRVVLSFRPRLPNLSPSFLLFSPPPFPALLRCASRGINSPPCAPWNRATSSPAADHHDGRCTASYCIVSNAFVPQHSMYIQARAFENTSFLMTPQATAHAAAFPPCRTISMRGEMPDWWAHFRLWGAWHIPGKAPRPPKKNAGIPARPWPWDAGSAVAWPGGAAPVERVTKHATAAWRVASLGGMLPQQIGGRSSRQGGARKAVARSMSTT